MRSIIAPLSSTTGAALEDFCWRVTVAVGVVPAPEIPASVADLLVPLLEAPNLLSPAQRALPATGRGRHEVFVCPEGHYSVIVMVWPPGFVSSIHDHRTWCAYGVYEGVIEETRYEPAELRPDCTRAVPIGLFERYPGNVDFLPLAGADIHSVRNPTDRIAISIHIYGGDAAEMGPNVDRLYTV